MSYQPQNDQILSQVFKTKDYGKFQFLQGNRPLKPHHLERLKASFQTKDLEVPIIVNEKYEIIDGQHRFEVQKELGLPIVYIQKRGYGLHEVHALNMSRLNWGIKDFMNSYADLGMEEYIKYREFWKKYRFDHLTCLGILLGHSSRAGGTEFTAFADGKFKIKSIKHAEELADKIMMVKELYPGYLRSNFVTAMIRLLNHPNYDHVEFLTKLRYQRDKMYDVASTNQYLQMIDEIYNYRRQGKKISFYWDLRTLPKDQ
jgi:hypothetical protein